VARQEPCGKHRHKDACACREQHPENYRHVAPRLLDLFVKFLQPIPNSKTDILYLSIADLPYVLLGAVAQAGDFYIRVSGCAEIENHLLKCFFH
jgi:hypothetical protein